VVGAGIVGLCVAWHLARGGARVTVLDGGEPGGGASSGNAGAISAGSVAPLAMPGVLRQVPGMLLDPEGALHIPPRYALRAAPWLIRFVASARPARVAAIAEALSSLLYDAMERHRAILAEEGALDLIRETGQLYLYRDTSTATGRTTRRTPRAGRSGSGTACGSSSSTASTRSARWSRRCGATTASVSSSRSRAAA
jgi:glycine/D-amino acid oxidase-like deaminating enzyme